MIDIDPRGSQTLSACGRVGMDVNLQAKENGNEKIGDSCGMSAHDGELRVQQRGSEERDR
jgi:hypothetical protein